MAGKTLIGMRGGIFYLETTRGWEISIIKNSIKVFTKLNHGADTILESESSQSFELFNPCFLTSYHPLLIYPHLMARTYMSYMTWLLQMLLMSKIWMNEKNIVLITFMSLGNLRSSAAPSLVHVGPEEGRGPSTRVWVKNRTYGLTDLRTYGHIPSNLPCDV